MIQTILDNLVRRNLKIIYIDRIFLFCHKNQLMSLDLEFHLHIFQPFIYRVFSKGRNGEGASKSLIFGTFPDVLGFLWPFNMGDFSFWYFGDIWLKKKLKNLILQKSKISGLAQIG